MFLNAPNFLTPHYYNPWSCFRLAKNGVNRKLKKNKDRIINELG